MSYEILCHRPFFALRPPTDIAEEIDRLSAIQARGLRRLRDDHLHITLAMTDDHPAFPRAVIDRMMAAGAAVAAAPVDVSLEVMSGWSRSVALRPRRTPPSLRRLQSAIVTAMRDRHVAERGGGYKFGPHVTLFYRDGAPFDEAIDPIAWTAAELLLIHSLVGRTQHEILGRWPLAGGTSDQLSLF